MINDYLRKANNKKYIFPGIFVIFVIGMSSFASQESLPQLLSSLSQNQVEALQQFHTYISGTDAYVYPDVMREHPIRFCLRYLRADDFNVKQATERYREYVQLAKDFNFRNVAESIENEYKENGPMFVCGHDVTGNIVIVCRPCSHLPKTSKDSEKAAVRCIYTMQLCADRMAPGHERATMIYDAGGVTSANWDMDFVKKISKMLGTCFPERIGRILMCNNGFLVSSLWKIVKTFLDPVTAAKIVFCGKNFEENLVPLLPPKHPYLEYLISKRDAKKRQGKTGIKLPKSDGYIAIWKQSVKSDYEDLQSWSTFDTLKLVNDARCIKNLMPPPTTTEKQTDHRDQDGDLHRSSNNGVDTGEKDSRNNLLGDGNRPSNKRADDRFVEGNSGTDNVDIDGENSRNNSLWDENTVTDSEEDGQSESTKCISKNYNSLSLYEKDSSSIYAVATQLYRVLEIKDRTYHFRTYKSCFLGSDCVAFIIALGLARTIEQAEALGNSLISKRLIQHVTNEHGLKNAYLFYHFLDFEPDENEEVAEKGMLMIHPMLPKYLESVGLLGTASRSKSTTVNRVVGQLYKRGNGRVRWNQRHIIIQGHIFLWKEDISSEVFKGKISLKDYICKACKSRLTSNIFFAFKLVDVHQNCLYFGSSNEAEMLNWMNKIQAIQATYVSEVLNNVNNAFAEIVHKFNSNYQLNSETNKLMKDPVAIASLVSSFRALSQRSASSYLVDIDFDNTELEEEVLL